MTLLMGFHRGLDNPRSPPMTTFRPGLLFGFDVFREVD